MRELMGIPVLCLSPGSPEEMQLLGQKLLGFRGFLDLARGG